jgi:hypothetical protein
LLVVAVVGWAAVGLENENGISGERDTGVMLAVGL